MNPAQLAAMSTLFSVPQQPRIVGVSVDNVAAASLTCNLPHRREAGLLAVSLLCARANSATSPTTPTDWTSITNNSGSTNGVRVVYKFLDGSEAPTFTTSTPSGTETLAITFTISGCISSRPPTGTSTNGADVASHTTTAPYGSPLWIVGCSVNVLEQEIERPIGFSTRYRREAGLSTINLVAMAENIAAQTVNPSAFTFPTATSFRSIVIAVRGA